MGWIFKGKIYYQVIYENRRSHTLLPRKPEPTNERELNQLACIMPSEEKEDEVNRGMRTEQIAEMINRQQLHVRKNGQPVTSNQVYAVICRYPEPTNEREQNQT